MWSKTYIHLIVGGIAFGCCVGIILIDPVSTAESRAFKSEPQFWIWLFLFCLQFSFWAIIASPLFKELKGLKRHFQENKLEVIITFSVSLAITVAYLCSFAFLSLPEKFPLPHYRLKIWTLMIPGFLIVFLALSGMWLVHIRARKIAAIGHSGEVQIAEYLKLLKQLNFFLLVVAILLGLGTLTLGALRHSLLVFGRPWFFIIPEGVLLWGAYFSFFIAIIFIPARVSIYRAGEHLRDFLFPIPKINSDKWSTWYSERKQFEDFLGLNIDPKSVIQSLLAIMTPFGSALITLLK